jgi:hypothetical protein
METPAHWRAKFWSSLASVPRSPHCIPQHLERRELLGSRVDKVQFMMDFIKFITTRVERVFLAFRVNKGYPQFR